MSCTYKSASGSGFWWGVWNWQYLHFFLVLVLPQVLTLLDDLLMNMKQDKTQAERVMSKINRRKIDPTKMSKFNIFPIPHPNLRCGQSTNTKLHKIMRESMSLWVQHGDYSISIMTPPCSFPCAVLLNANRVGSTGKRTRLGVQGRSKWPFKFSNCALARWTRSICIQRYSATKWIQGLAMEC